MYSLPKLQQPKLEQFLKKNDSTALDLAVTQWALAHDLPPHAMQGPYWRQLNKKLAQVSPTYSPMYPRKIFSDMMPQLKAQTSQTSSNCKRSTKVCFLLTKTPTETTVIMMTLQEILHLLVIGNIGRLWGWRGRIIGVGELRLNCVMIHRVPQQIISLIRPSYV